MGWIRRSSMRARHAWRLSDSCHDQPLYRIIKSSSQSTETTPHHSCDREAHHEKLVLLLSVIALLIVATGAVSAAKPAPDTFTITGYTTNDPFTDPETVMRPDGRMRLHVTARGGGATDTAYDGLCA